MKDQRKTEIRVGVTVALAILLFISLLTWAKNFSLSAQRKFLTVKFENISGLEVGDNVMVNGVRSGYVYEIKKQSNYVLVKLSLEDDVELKEDAIFGIGMLDLMGGKKIEIRPGISANEIDYKKLQSGIFYFDVPEVMNMMGSLSSELPALVKNVNLTLNSINNYFNDKKLVDDIKTSLGNLAEISEKLNLLISENKDNIRILTKNSVDLTNEAKEFIQTNKEDLSNSLKNINELISRSNAFISKIDNLVDETSNKKNNIGKLLYDEKLITDLKESLNSVKELTNLLVEQLKKKGIKVDADIF